MISVTHFAFENIAISKVHAAQDGGDQDGEGQGQVRSMMLCFNVFSQRLFNWKTIITNSQCRSCCVDQPIFFSKTKKVGFPNITLKSLLWNFRKKSPTTSWSSSSVRISHDQNAKYFRTTSQACCQLGAVHKWCHLFWGYPAPPAPPPPLFIMSSFGSPPPPLHA